jgi:acyl dehydratase
MSETDPRPVFSYDHYEVDKVYGEREFVVSEEVLSKWRTAYPGDYAGDEANEHAPAGMLSMIIIDAIIALNSPRPPGGVHAGQTYEVTRWPKAGETLITEVRCLSKEIRNERRWVKVRTTTRSAADGELLFAGTMTTLVAA